MAVEAPLRRSLTCFMASTEPLTRATRPAAISRSARLRSAVVAAFMAGLDDELLLISTSGVVIRMAVREIASQGRDATGVRVMNLGEGDAVAAVAPVAGEAAGDA